jgi:hypothetical protein
MDLQRVFAAIAASAARLCDALDVTINVVDGGVLRIVAHYGPIKIIGAVGKTQTLVGEVSPGRAVLDRRTVHVADMQAETEEYPEGSDRARRVGFRTILAIPLMRADEAIGAILIRRTEVRPFTERQVELVATFADQPVIAIENTRLFEEVQARTRELTEALEQQTATADVLKVISRSALDVESVLDALVESAARLCDANDSVIYQLFGDSLHLVAHHGQIPLGGPVGKYAIPLVRGRIPGRVVIDRRTIPHRSAPVHRQTDRSSQDFRRSGRHRHREHKRELQESLEYQTATSEILGVISRSPNELQPVLDTIVMTAERLCQAEFALVMKRADDGLYRVAASSNANPLFVEWMNNHPVTAGDGTNSGLVLLEKRTIH